MNYFHLEAKIVSRGAGRSVIAAAAYASCSRLYNDYDGLNADIFISQTVAFIVVEQIGFYLEKLSATILWNLSGKEIYYVARLFKKPVYITHVVHLTISISIRIKQRS